ncbi:MAG: RDD family protein [Ilumatobacteraceae bacterium]
MTPLDVETPLRNDLYGHRAGVATRLFAFLVDLFTILLLFTVGGHVVSFVLSIVLGNDAQLFEAPLVSSLALVLWAFTYCAYLLAAYGCTFGMALFGIRVVRHDGGAIGIGHAVGRVLVFPLSFLVLCLGFALIVLRRDRRALHDLIARTAVIYAWEARSANLGFLAKRQPAARSSRSARQPTPHRLGQQPGDEVDRA